MFLIFPSSTGFLNLTTAKDALWARVAYTGEVPLIRTRALGAAICTTEAILLIGGRSEPELMNDIVTIDLRTTSYTVTKHSYKRYGMAFVQTNRGWVLFGGMSDPLTMENDLWLAAPDPTFFSATAGRGDVLSPGNFSLTQISNSSPSKNPVTGIHDRPVGRRDGVLAYYNDSIYLMGGITGEDACGYLWKTEYPWGKHWAIINSSEHIQARFGHSVHISYDTMVVFGGRDALNNILPMPALMYNFTADVWAPMRTTGGPGPRAYFSSSPVAGLKLDVHWVFFFGGMSDSGLHNDLFVFDLKQNQWLELSPVETPALVPRFGANLCALTTRPDLDDLSLFVFGGAMSNLRLLNDSWANNFRLCGRGSNLRLGPGKPRASFTDGSDGASHKSAHAFTHPGNQTCTWRIGKQEGSTLRIEAMLLHLEEGDSLLVYQTPCAVRTFPVHGLVGHLSREHDYFELMTCAWVVFKTAPGMPSFSYFNITYSEVLPIYEKEFNPYLWPLVGVGIGLLLLCLLLWCFYRRHQTRNRFSVMLSYSHKNMEFAEQLQRGLEAGGLKVWIDKRILPGEDWREHIAHAIEESFAVIFIISKPSVQSRYCKEEVYYAKKKEKYIIPVIFEHVPEIEWKSGLRAKLPPAPWLDFSREDRKKNLRLLVRDLRERHHFYKEAMALTADKSTPLMTWRSFVPMLRRSSLMNAPPPPEELVIEHEPKNKAQGRWNVYICYEPGSKRVQGLRMALAIRKNLQSHGITCVLAARESVLEAYRMTRGYGPIGGTSMSSLHIGYANSGPNTDGTSGSSSSEHSSESSSSGSSSSSSSSNSGGGGNSSGVARDSTSDGPTPTGKRFISLRQQYERTKLVIDIQNHIDFDDPEMCAAVSLYRLPELMPPDEEKIQLMSPDSMRRSVTMPNFAGKITPTNQKRTVNDMNISMSPEFKRANKEFTFHIIPSTDHNDNKNNNNDSTSTPKNIINNHNNNNNLVSPSKTNDNDNNNNAFNPLSPFSNSTNSSDGKNDSDGKDKANSKAKNNDKHDSLSVAGTNHARNNSSPKENMNSPSKNTRSNNLYSHRNEGNTTVTFQSSPIFPRSSSDTSIVSFQNAHSNLDSCENPAPRHSGSKSLDDALLSTSNRRRGSKASFADALAATIDEESSLISHNGSSSSSSSSGTSSSSGNTLEEPKPPKRPHHSPWTYFNFNIRGPSDSKRADKTPSPQGSPALSKNSRRAAMPPLDLEGMTPIVEHSETNTARNSSCEIPQPPPAPRTAERLSLHHRKTSAGTPRRPSPEKVANVFEHNTHLIDQCQLVIFVEFADSVVDTSECIRELKLAQQAKKKVVRVKWRRKYEMPASLRADLLGAELLDFTSEKCRLQNDEWKWFHLMGVVFQGLSDYEMDSERLEEIREEKTPSPQAAEKKLGTRPKHRAAFLGLDLEDFSLGPSSPTGEKVKASPVHRFVHGITRLKSKRERSGKLFLEVDDIKDRASGPMSPGPMSPGPSLAPAPVTPTKSSSSDPSMTSSSRSAGVQHDRPSIEIRTTPLRQHSVPNLVLHPPIPKDFESIRRATTLS